MNIKLLDKLLGFGVVPEGWKTALVGFAVALVVLLKQAGVDVPDWIDEAWITKAVATAYMAVTMLLKYLRGQSA